MGEPALQVKPDPVFPPTRQHLVLIDLVRRHGWTAGAEIGLLRGKTFFALLEACPDLYLIGVDQWKQLPPSDVDGAEHYQKYDMAELARHVTGQAKRYLGRAKILHGASLDMVKQVPDRSLDFVFIDAAHTTDAAQADILAWGPKVKPEGRILGHDWQWPSVQKALENTLECHQRLAEQVWEAAPGALKGYE